MEILKRIDLSRVREAFEQAGIKPSRLKMNNCIMRVICGDYPSSENIRNTGLDLEYVTGVMNGWDNYKPINYSERSLTYNVGFADGQAAWTIMSGKAAL